ncbi:hypothetical protein M5G20_21315 [Pseudomonas sp. TNT2022 ID1044]|uniref:hypothetical protein n=1 Tax=Pseudomonas sp. TNT2022 ID1044 TaxID=2942636 RepID=UPI0023606240|nr:hypothetical protein [Pseudomonas sp. TNT2022 ID1044]MDD0998388.1 hypothetical protein [Pseudomonas sp. TNT2022 ID1044]
MLYLHRLLFYPLVLISFLWGVCALRVNPFALFYHFEFLALLKALYIIGFTAAFWPLAYIELVDYVHSRLGKNGRYHLECSRSLQKDLIVAGLTAVALAGIYWLDSVGYVFSGVDIAFVGFPFLINALYTLVQATQVSVAGQPIRKRAPLFIFCVVLGGTATAYWLLVKNASGELATDQALYLQLTILFSGICFFLSSNFMLYWWRSGRVESSPFKRYFLTEVVVWPKLNLYRDMDKVIEPFNRQLEQRKSQHAAAIRRQQKGRPRKR